MFLSGCSSSVSWGCLALYPPASPLAPMMIKTHGAKGKRSKILLHLLHFSNSLTLSSLWHKGQVTRLPHGADSITPASCGDFHVQENPLKQWGWGFCTAWAAQGKSLGKRNYPSALTWVSHCRKTIFSFAVVERSCSGSLKRFLGFQGSRHKLSLREGLYHSISVWV